MAAGARDPVAMVFATPELPEIILLEIATNHHKLGARWATPSGTRCADLKTLLVKQRVDRNFASVIKASPHLQQALFFAYDTDQPDTEPTVVNPFIDFFSCYCPERQTQIVLHWETYKEHAKIMLKAHALVDRATGASELIEGSSYLGMLLSSRPVETTIWTYYESEGCARYLELRAGATLAEVLADYVFDLKEYCALVDIHIW